MTDSLVVGGVIELLGSGQASTHPQAAGAYFRLGTGFDLSAPQMTADQAAGLLLDGEVVSNFRASNRTPTIPVVIGVPPTGNYQADRLTLAGARELLLQTASQDQWELVWTRDGADPLIFDCMGLATVVVHYALKTEQALLSQVDITFAAFPYARSDVLETMSFASPAAIWPAPPSVVTVDDMTVADNWLAGDASTFDASTGGWVSVANCAVAQVASPVHAGAGALRLRSAAAGNMDAAFAAAANVLTLGFPCQAGDTVNVRTWFRAATTGRASNSGASFYDSNGTFISTLRGSDTTTNTTGYTQISAALTAPAGTAWAIADAQVKATAAANEDHFIDDVSIDRGPVFSYDTPLSWTRSTQAATGSFSARWSRKIRDNPTYDHILTAPVDITGVSKWMFWFGLGTSPSQWPVWHTGTVSFSVTLYDATGQSVSFGIKRKCHASALEGSPHWQLISAHIPQLASGFDYTTLSRYVISAWNLWDPRKIQSTGKPAGPVLQSGCYINLVRSAPTSVGSPVNRTAFYQLPGTVGTARSPMSLQIAPGPSSFSTIAEFTTPGVNAFTTGVGVTKIDKSETWAAGGGGAGEGTGTGGGGGGGAGEYAMELNIPVLASTSYPATVGAAGAGGAVGSQGSNGGDSFWSGQSGPVVRAHGGKGGWQSASWGGGKGGTGSTNYVHNDGGNGRQSNVNGLDGNRGGGGGSSGGPAAAGRDATGRQGSGAVTDGGPGGDGGNEFVTPHAGATPTTGPGGGGGGANVTGSNAGAAGRNGKVRLTYGASGLIPLQSVLVHSPGRDEPDAYVPVCPVGSGADVPNGSTEYQIPDLGNLNARYAGTYTMFLVASSFSSPGSSRNLTVQMRQYPYSGGAAVTQNVVRNGLTPSTDLLGTQTYVDMGPVTLPLADIPPGSLSPYFACTVTSTLTADRFLDMILISTQGDFVMINVGSGSVLNNIWVDAPDAARNLGRVLGSNADRDQAVSILQYVERFSGGPLAIYPDGFNRLLLYSAQGAPALIASYGPRWWTERLS